MTRPVATTNRLLIRQLVTADAEFIHALVNTEGWLQNIGDRNVHSVEDAVKYIERSALASYKSNGFGLWMIAKLDSGEPMGICGLIRRPGLDDVDIGFAFMPAFQGKGYAFEAATVAVKQANALGIKKLVAITLPRNFPSVKLLERLGFVFEKTITLPGENAELSLYGLQIKT